MTIPSRLSGPPIPTGSSPRSDAGTSVRFDPLAVSPKRAQHILDIGHTRLYQLIAARELESYNEGRSRKITMRSINKYIERQLGHDGRFLGTTRPAGKTAGES